MHISQFYKNIIDKNKNIYMNYNSNKINIIISSHFAPHWAPSGQEGVHGWPLGQTVS